MGVSRVCLFSGCEEGGSRVGLPRVLRRLAGPEEDRSECAALQEREALTWASLIG